MINKITPTHTVCWYTKWIASVFIIIGVLLSSNTVSLAILGNGIIQYYVE